MSNKDLSSERYKTNIANYTKTENDIVNLQPITYNLDRSYTIQNKADPRTFVGFTAEHLVEQGLTEFVKYDDRDQPHDVYYEKMVTILVNCVNNLKTALEALELRVLALEP